jgi:hypothetical protein
MRADKQTIFLLPETSGDLRKSTTHLGLSKMVVFGNKGAGGRRSGSWLYGK